MSSFPSSNKSLENKWRQRSYEAHKEKLGQAKSSVDCHAPRRFPHLKVRLTQVRKQEVEQSKIEKENRVLLNTLTSIMSSPSKVDHWNEYDNRNERNRSLNRTVRERELDAIARENQKIAERLMTVKPRYTLVNAVDNRPYSSY